MNRTRTFRVRSLRPIDGQGRAESGIGAGTSANLCRIGSVARDFGAEVPSVQTPRLTISIVVPPPGRNFDNRFPIDEEIGERF
jgi:hypothetical protein